MARDVNDVIIDIISEYKKIPKSSAQDFLKSKFKNAFNFESVYFRHA